MRHLYSVKKTTMCIGIKHFESLGSLWGSLRGYFVILYSRTLHFSHYPSKGRLICSSQCLEKRTTYDVNISAFVYLLFPHLHFYNSCPSLLRLLQIIYEPQFELPGKLKFFSCYCREQTRRKFSVCYTFFLFNIQDWIISKPQLL